jgi:hypothetical protein
MPTPFLDTLEYYELRATQIQTRLMLRAYYEGNPYGPNPDDPRNDNAAIRNSVLHGQTGSTDVDENGNLIVVKPAQPDRAADMDYIENCPRARINNVIGGVLPKGCSIQFKQPDGKPPLEKDVRDALCKQLFNFGNRIEPGEAGFFHWLRLNLQDCGTVGDGLILPKLLPADERRSLSMRAAYTYYPFESWDLEIDPETGDVTFYRIEFKIKDEKGVEWIYRVDVYDNRVIYWRLHKVAIKALDSIPPPAATAMALDPMASFSARQMTVDRESTEGGILPQLPSFCCVDVCWERNTTDDRRGRPEVWLEGIAGTDAVNETLNLYLEGVIYAGSRPLAAIDLEPLRDQAGKARSLTKADMAAGSVAHLKSSGSTDHQGKLAYPENIPTAFPHPEALREIRSATMAGVPYFRGDSRGFSEIGRMGGYGYRTIMSSFIDKIDDIRTNTVSRFVHALQNGFQMLALKDALPVGVHPDTVIEIHYPDENMTEDERAKRVLALLGLQKFGVPSGDLVSMIPAPIESPEQLRQSLKESDEAREEMTQLGIEAQQAALEPQTPEAPTDAPDKQYV